MRELFAQDKQRFSKFSIQHGDLLFDYSKNRITDVTITKLVDLYQECDVSSWRTKMFAGDEINSTENRAVQHVALRDLSNQSSNIAKQQCKVLEQMEAFISKLEASCITDVVNIGIGGSHLGPQFVCDALQAFSTSKFKLHFVANVDAEEINRVLNELKPKNTLFIVTSKSFSTQETLANAITAKKWLENNSDEKNEDHFIAVSANVDRAVEFGIAKENIFPMWDAIGGRFSLWSAVGLSIAVAIGMQHFKSLLEGACTIDDHFCNAPVDENIPALMALLDIWNQHFIGATAHAVLPYDVRLTYLPAFLQQLVMESNGKSVDREGNSLTAPSSAVLFGDVGTNAQHSFFQLLHQGTQSVSCDFIGVVNAVHDNTQQHEMLLANMLAQTQALMLGQTRDEVGDQAHAEHKVFSGNRVSNTIFLKELTPHALGMLLALYEHKTFVHGILLNINSFDQMGVELGKKLANNLIGNFNQPETVPDQDSSTDGLFKFYQENKSEHS